jgi:hypothetical protein
MCKFCATLKAMLKRWNWQCFFSSTAFVLSLFTVGIIVFGNLRSDITPYLSDGLIIAFVGILATFVVVSNYAQVQEIERKVEKSEIKTSATITNLETTTQRENEITKLEIIGAFMVELVQSIGNKKKHEVLLSILMYQAIAYWKLVRIYKRDERINIQYMNTSFSQIDEVLNDIEKKQIKISWNTEKANDYLSTISEIDDPRFVRIRNFLTDLINKQTHE